MTLARISKATLVLTAGFFAACEKKKDDTPATTAEQAKAEAVTSADSPNDLKIGTLNVTLPAAFDPATSTSLSLTDASKSQQACMMGQTIKEVVERIDSVRNFFCHIEVESAKIQFGTKYKITTQGQEFGRIWIDNSEAASGKITLNFCNSRGSETNNETITITGITDDGVVGNIKNMGSSRTESETHNYETDLSFDTTVAKTVSITAGQAFSASGGGSFKRTVVLNLIEDGLSTISLASSGTWSGSAFSEAGYVKANATHGSAVFSNSGTYGGQAFSFNRIARFDKDGYVVSDYSAIPAFGADGELLLTAANIPEQLPANYTTGVTANAICEAPDSELTTVDLDPDSAEHQACESERSDGYVDCWSNYQGGEQL